MQWWIYALLSAVFAALVSILAKAGLRGIDSDLATAVRTSVVVPFAWIVAASLGKVPQLTQWPARTWCFIVASGLATGLSWLCFYRALSNGRIAGVLALDKLSVSIAIILAAVLLRERFGWREACAIVLLTSGALLLVK
jgi:transporter family protein